MRLYNEKKYSFDLNSSAVKTFQTKFKKDGILILEDFIDPQALPKVIEEAYNLCRSAFHSRVEGNCYLSEGDPSYSDDHPENLTDYSSLGAVAYDQFTANSLCLDLYKNEQFRLWLASVLQIQKVYEYGCPLGSLNATSMIEDDYLRWHFDRTDFVVGIHLQDPEEGGFFEYARNLRQPDSPQYEEVQKVLFGDRRNVIQVKPKPGSLILFEGRYTLHRVSKVTGKTPRLNLLLGFADCPGVSGSDYLRMIRYGRMR